MKKLLVVSFMLIFGMVACKKEEVSKKDTTNDKVTTPVADTLGKGDFIGVDHNLSGKAVLFKDTSDNYILRLENYTMTAAPDADILLSKTSTYNAANVIKVYDLAQNTNYTNSNINIDVDNGIDFTQYKYIISWCEQYSAYFGHAKLE